MDDLDRALADAGYDAADAPLIENCRLAIDAYGRRRRCLEELQELQAADQPTQEQSLAILDLGHEQLRLAKVIQHALQVFFSTPAASASGLIAKGAVMKIIDDPEWPLADIARSVAEDGDRLSQHYFEAARNAPSTDDTLH